MIRFIAAAAVTMFGWIASANAAPILIDDFEGGDWFVTPFASTASTPLGASSAFHTLDIELTSSGFVPFSGEDQTCMGLASGCLSVDSTAMGSTNVTELTYKFPAMSPGSVDFTGMKGLRFDIVSLVGGPIGLNIGAMGGTGTSTAMVTFDSLPGPDGLYVPFSAFSTTLDFDAADVTEIVFEFVADEPDSFAIDTITAVSVPQTALFLGTGLLLIGFVGRRRMR